MSQNQIDTLNMQAKSTDALVLAESIKNYIKDNDCPSLSMDISHLNLLDASKVTVLCSTYHWAKYPDGKISLKTGSNALKDLIMPLNLGNINLINAL